MAHYEIKSETSVIEDDRWLEIRHPKNLFRARIRNIVRTDFATPFLLTLHLYFDAPSLEVADDVAEELLADCLNMLVLVTGCRFSRHRIRQIVDATSEAGSMRNLRMWADSIGHEDPHPVLDDRIAETAARLLQHDVPQWLRRAMRWYRIGVNAKVPDDQFQYFWFALELVAISKEPAEKVHDRCQNCKSPLYCEKCKAHPMHWPFERQKIRALMQAVDKESDDARLDMLEKARNTLMHGGTLREIQDRLPEPHEQIVNVLGKIVFLVLVNQFPREIFSSKMSFLNPSTYVGRTMLGVAHMQMPVRRDVDGNFDLSFSGTTAKMVTNGPPQSAVPSGVRMTREHHQRLTKLAYRSGDHKDMCRRIAEAVHQENASHVVVVVLATDMRRIRVAVENKETGDWQELFREILGNAGKQPEAES